VASTSTGLYTAGALCSRPGQANNSCLLWPVDPHSGVNS